jgi:hypothetical protein
MIFFAILQMNSDKLNLVLRFNNNIDLTEISYPFKNY